MSDSGTLRHSGYLVVANGSAGSSDSGRIETAAGLLASDGPTELMWLDDLDVTALPAAVGNRRLVIAGGDGTIHLVIDALHRADRHRDVVVGLLPAGTGNDTARGLGLPLDVAAAARSIIAGCPEWLAALSVCVGDGPQELVLNALHLGVGAEAAARAAPWKRVLHRFAYPAGAAVVGATYQPFPVDAVIDDVAVGSHDALAVIVAHGSSIGGGVELVGDASLSEPSARLLVVGAAPRLRRLGIGLAGLRGTLDAHDEVLSFQLSDHAVLRLDRSIAANIDGELASWSGEVRIDVVPHAWQVLRPPPAASGER